MARITVPEGAGGELVQVWSLSPELGAAVGGPERRGLRRPIGEPPGT